MVQVLIGYHCHEQQKQVQIFKKKTEASKSKQQLITKQVMIAVQQQQPS